MIAISNGCVQAMYKYGKILIEGNEMIKNKDESINYIKISVNKGNPNALFYYSLLLFYEICKTTDFNIEINSKKM